MHIEALIADPHARTVRELDRLHGRVKGTAFRAFKGLASELIEDRDFACCTASSHPDAFEALRAAQRLYPGTVTAIVIGPAACRRLAAILAAR